VTGTENQISWAQLIKVRVSAEFDRVSNALVRYDRPGILALLEEKRSEVMANDRAGYFIQHWGEMNGQVRRLIQEDPRYPELRKGPRT
jgi:hypothetical protein